jgi:radical SAM superfamily enzyme YgiQ (UPF0313 family)
MSSLGFQTLYRLFNEMEAVVCERVFVPDDGGPPRSIETDTPLAAFDIAAFSLSFESDYPLVLTLLDLGGIPIPSANRDASHPLIMAGGVACFLNPEPLADFFDLFLLGEAEANLAGLMNLFDPKAERQDFLRKAGATVKGAYIPRFYSPLYNDDNTLAAFEPKQGMPSKVLRAAASGIESFSTESCLYAEGTTFHDTHLVEVSRGCPHACRFCCTGYIYRPVRFRPYEMLRSQMENGAKLADHVGLLGAAVSDHPDLDRLCAFALEQGIRLSFSSFRADALTQTRIDAIASGNVKTATLAPDAGSARMRKIIRKGIEEGDILDAAQRLIAAGLMNLKLYFMAGLPFEQESDVAAIIDLTKKIRERFLEQSRPKGRIGRIQVSINSFVPKPWTPFQWAAMEGVLSLKAKIRLLKKELARLPNVSVSVDDPKKAWLQALFARGDRRVGQILLAGHANRGNWPMTFKASQVDPDFFVSRTRGGNELFPWDFIDQDTPKSLLKKEWEKAKKTAAENP